MKPSTSKIIRKPQQIVPIISISWRYGARVYMNIKNYVKYLDRLLGLFGIQPRKLFALLELPSFLTDYRRFKNFHEKAKSPFALGRVYPYLKDKEDCAGTGSGHYFHQDLWVARRILERRPRRHADVGSRIDGFVAHVAVFRELEVFDIRISPPAVKNIIFRQMDLMKGIDPKFQAAFDSVSCLHALEHLGLGRYGDSLDYWGFLRGIEALSGLICDGGILYLSVPIGAPRIEFNAQRIFSLDYLYEICKIGQKFNLEQLSYVDDAGNFHENLNIDDVKLSDNLGCFYGLAILEMKKSDGAHTGHLLS